MPSFYKKPRNFIGVETEEIDPSTGQKSVVEVFGDYICDCINANDGDSYQDHVDNKWDYYTYRTDQVTDGIQHPSVAPRANPYNEAYAVSANGINQNCWINDLLDNPPPSIPISVGTRGFNARYFNPGFTDWYIFCDNDYNEPCWNTFIPTLNPDLPNYYRSLTLESFKTCGPDPFAEIDKLRRKIGNWAPTTSAVIPISPRHALLCRHCVGYYGGPDGTGIETYVVLYDPGAQTFVGRLVKTVTPTVLPGPCGGSSEFHDRLSACRDVRIAEIVNPDETFPIYFTEYLNPYSYKDWIITTNQNLNNGLVAFFLDQHGIFSLGELQFSNLSLIQDNGTVQGGVQPDLQIGLRYEKIKNIDQPKAVSYKTGDSGTSYFHYTKNGNILWPGGSIYGQYITGAWRKIDGKFLVDEVNQYLRSVGERELQEYTDFDNIYKFSDFVSIPGGSDPSSDPESPAQYTISSDDNPSQFKHILNIFPYLSRKLEIQNKNYNYLAFKPGILLQSAELNEFQEHILLQQSLTLSLANNWPLFGKKYQKENNLDFSVYEEFSGKFDEIYEFPIPNENYCISQKPSQIQILSVGNGLYITISEGWYNVPVRDETVWCYLDQPQTILLNIGSSIDTQIYIIVNEEIVQSSFNSQDEGYEFHDKSNRFLNPITDGADRVKVTLQLTEFPENGAVPILRVRKNTDTFISSNRILVQSMNKYKIFDINN
jgi:hypothetical protein